MDFHRYKEIKKDNYLEKEKNSMETNLSKCIKGAGCVICSSNGKQSKK